MKRKLIAAFILAAILILLTGCGRNEFARISDTLGVDLTGGTVVTSYDDHGGFLGDGTTFLKLQFSDSSCYDQIMKSSEWNALPLTNHLTMFLEGTSPLLSDANGVPFLPDVENGYYCFIDRHYESTDPKDDSELMHRYSFNVTLAVFDCDTNTLYYIKLDT